MAFDIKTLRQQKAVLVAKNRALLQAAETANRDLTATESTEYESNKTAIASLNTRIARVEEQMDAERALPNSQSIEVSKPEASKKPWASFGEQLTATAEGTKLAERGYTSRLDPRLFAALGANESVPAEGGYLVAPEYADGILQKTYEVGEIASRCRQITMSSNRLMNAVDEDTRRQPMPRMQRM